MNYTGTFTAADIVSVPYRFCLRKRLYFTIAHPLS